MANTEQASAPNADLPQSASLQEIWKLFYDPRWENLVKYVRGERYPPPQIHLLDAGPEQGSVRVWIEHQGVHIQKGHSRVPYGHHDVDEIVAELQDLDEEHLVSILEKLQECLERHKKT